MSAPTPRTAAAWLSEWKAHENSGGRSSPAHGMCDFAESLERELAALKAELARKDELIDDLRAMHGVPSDADLARARDDEARACASAAQTFYDFGPATQCPRCGERDQVLRWYTLGRDDAGKAISRRISERAK